MDMEDKAHESTPDLEKETRFAVVMYGGISLAIYINGVAQELYSLVRATAVKKNGDYLYELHELSGAEVIYRALGETLKTKFVVDILSGTSAGGINAVYLAKALVNDQSFNTLKDLWINEGDISLLVNDGESVHGLSGLKLQTPPSSLMNNQRMYYELLAAFKKMGDKAPKQSSEISPYVQELDLSVTASDIRGLIMPLDNVENAKVDEARFKTVFQFHYSTKEAAGDSNSDPSDQKKGDEIYSNHFTKDFDPFLAFAARCTSSIPPAFEPMQLADIEPILKTATFKTEYSYDPLKWKDIYKDYFDAGDDFPLRSFADGGYLDNKPFSYATETLLRRRADLPIDRKLIYIDPAPEHPEDQPLSTERPDLFENVFAALSGLPRQEPIREDLNALAERNKIIERINEMTSDIGSVAFSASKKQKNGKLVTRPSWVLTKEWADKYLMESDVLNWYGSSYAPYHQLRVAAVIDDLVSALSRNLGFAGSKEKEKQLHLLLDAWREKRYFIQKKGGKYSENDILFRLDLPYRMRQINLLQNLLDEMLLHLDSFNPSTPAKSKQTRAQKIAAVSNVELTINDEEQQYYRWTLIWLKEELNNALVYLRARGRFLRSRNLAKTLEVPKTFSHAQHLKDFVDHLKKLSAFFDEKNTNQSHGIELVEDLTVSLATHLDAPEPKGYVYWTLKENSSHVRDALGIPHSNKKIQKLKSEDKLYKKIEKEEKENYKPAILTHALKSIRKILVFYFEQFEYYDMLTFPLQFGTDVGETDQVEVIRVSPEDGINIVNERESGRHKLAGLKLASFGAFFDKEWRQNDMLWGRLDASEILMRELLKESCDGDQKKYSKKLAELGERCKALLAALPNSNGNLTERDAKEIQIPLPFALAFQSILNEDLRPRDRSLLYKFLDDDLPAREKPSAEKPAPENDLLHKLKVQDDELKKLEEDLYQTIRKHLGTGTNPLREAFLQIIEKERAKLKVQIQKLEDENTQESQTTQSVLRKLDEGKTPIQSVTKKMDGLKETDTSRYRDLMRSITHDKSELLAYFKYGYQVNTDFQPKPTLQIASRSMRVLAGMTDGLSKKYPILKGPAGFILALSRVFVAMAQAVLAPTVATLFFAFFYIVGIVLFFGGMYFKFNDAKMIGEYVFGLTLLAHLLFYLADGIVYSKIPISWLSKSISIIVVLLLIAIFGLAYLELVHLGVLVPPEIIKQWLAPLLK